MGAATALAGESTDVLPSVRAKVDRPPPDRPEGMPPDAQLEAARARIGRVIIIRDTVFDTSRPEEDAAIPRLANRLHIRTRQSTIESQLLFQEGDVYRARDLAESERLLRKTRYLQEASVRPIAWHDGVVDVEVRTHDVWTLNPGASFGRSGGESSTGVQFEELNLLGFGSQVSVGFTSDPDRDSESVLFNDQQMFGTWWGLQAQAANNSDGRTYLLDVEHPFFAMNTRWAGGINLRDDERIDSLYDRGEIVDRFNTRQRRAEIYAGWSPGLHAGWTRRLTAGFTFDESRFDPGPDEWVTGYVPPDRKLAYPWIGYEWLQDRYAKARNRDRIEKTEDVNLGWRIATRLGYSAPGFGADRDATIFSARVDKGLQPDPMLMMLFTGSVGGRVEGGSWTDTLASVGARYYLRQSPRRLLYVGLQVDQAESLDRDHQLLLGGDNGLRGYPLRYQGGEGRWLFTAEQRWFTDWYPFRMINVGAAMFFDAGRSWGENPLGQPSLGVLKDIGVGLRLGNNRSALGNVLHVDIAMPLNATGSIDKVQFLIKTHETF
jgi:hypothetical protein